MSETAAIAAATVVTVEPAAAVQPEPGPQRTAVQVPELQLPDTVAQAFSRHCIMLSQLLDELSAAELSYAERWNGMSVRQLLEHLLDYRREWIMQVSPALAERLGDVAVLAPLGGQVYQAALKKAFHTSKWVAIRAAEQAVRQRLDWDGVNQPSPGDPTHLLLDTIMHESYHRGQIMTLIRQHGHSARRSLALERAMLPGWRQ